MRKLLLTTAAVAAAIAGAVAGEPSFGTFTDTRDGQTYKTVTIGTQTWMAQNINYKTKNGSWCYEDSISYCKRYGRLYDWKTATTVCPNRWKLPLNSEWNDLVAASGGEKTAGKRLKSKSGWKNDWGKSGNRYEEKSGNGTDNYGFSALPGGGRDARGYFHSAGNNSYWWTNTVDGNIYIYYFYRGMGYDNDSVSGYFDHYNVTYYGYSVRCVADRP